MRTQIAVVALTLACNAASATSFPRCPDSSRRDFDVIVVGAGTSGIMAAIQASRLRASVALIEEHNMIGGQIAAGVGGMDGGVIPPVRSGLFAEYRDRIHAFYNSRGYTATTCFWGSGDTCSSPSVSSQIFWEMLAELPRTGSVLCPFPNKKVTGVLKNGNVVTGLTTSSPTETWTSHVVIDATEYGDLIDDAGASYRVGRARVPGDDIANNCIQDITYVGVVRDYFSSSASPDIPPPPGYLDPDNTLVPRRTQLRAEVNESPDGAPPFPYDCPLDWDAPRPPWGIYGDHNGYRAIPDLANPNDTGVTRTAVNYINDYPGFWTEDCRHPNAIVHWRGKLTADFIEDEGIRADISCEAKLLTLQLLHHMQTSEDPGTPEPEIQKPTWGIADDEYVGSPNVCPILPPNLHLSESRLPPLPYVRESRRIVALDTLTGLDIRRVPTTNPPTLEMAPNNPEALAVGEYGTDVHNCDGDGDYESYLGVGEVRDHRSTAGGPFQIPFGTFIPLVIDGFLPAEKNLGYTRLASSAARVQPTTMLVGQAAGALAALASNAGVQPRAVRLLSVQEALLDAHAALARQTFTDVPIGHASWRDVQLVALHEVMTGFLGGPTTFQFQPDSWATRGTVIAALDKLFTPTPPLPGSDPDIVLRAELAEAFAVGLWGSPLPPEPTTNPIFVDVPQGSGSLRYAIERLYTEGFVKPCTSSGQYLWFCPAGVAGKARREALALAAAEVMLQYWP
jgi:hypothetical protein